MRNDVDRTHGRTAGRRDAGPLRETQPDYHTLLETPQEFCHVVHNTTNTRKRHKYTQ